MTGPIQLPSAGNAGADPQSSSTSSVAGPTQQTESKDLLSEATMPSVPTSEPELPTIDQIQEEMERFMSGGQTVELPPQQRAELDTIQSEMESFMSANGTVPKSQEEAGEYDEGQGMVLGISPENPISESDEIAATWQAIERRLGDLYLPRIKQHNQDQEIPFS